jgi:hypothetical protein
MDDEMQCKRRSRRQTRQKVIWTKAAPQQKEKKKKKTRSNLFDVFRQYESRPYLSLNAKLLLRKKQSSNYRLKRKEKFVKVKGKVQPKRKRTLGR